MDAGRCPLRESAGNRLCPYDGNGFTNSDMRSDRCHGGKDMGTIIVGLVLIAIVGLAVRSMIRDKKAGKSIQCGGDCKHCGGGHCH